MDSVRSVGPVGTSLAEPASQVLLAAALSLGVGMALSSWQSTAIGSVLFMNHGLDHTTTVLIERILAALLLFATLALVPGPTRVAGATVLLGVAVVLTWANVDQAGYPYSRYAWAAHAMRLAAPLAVLVLFVRRGWRDDLRRTWLIALLVVASGITFTLHGIEAIGRHPWFIDMTIGAAEKLSWRMSESQATSILLVVGIVDLASALALVLWRRPEVAAWMALWGLFTAGLRVLTYGAGAWSETLVRLPQALLPLALVILWKQAPWRAGVKPTRGSLLQHS